MALLSLDRHDVLETIRQSNSLHEAFLRIAKLPTVEDRTATNADRIRSMTDEELANWYFDEFFPSVGYCRPLGEECPDHKDCKICLLEWLKQESEGE